MIVNRRAVARLATSLVLLSLLALAAATGGAGIGSGVAGATAQPGNTTVMASGDGITIQTRSSALLQGQLRFAGTVRSSRGQTVEIERLGHETGGAWVPTAHGTVGRNGSFTALWRTNHIGRFAIRAVIGTGAHAAGASPSLTVTVYRPAIATIYGPGFYRQRTACGQVLKPTTIGVANRTLKCGTPVSIYYQGQTIVVPVIDRGPYANHADWDLTEATAAALGITGTETIGAVSVPVG